MGWTSAEYERPVSLRHCRSWMPARKSRASRIIGERDVRSIAASTSASTDASVPSTIWMTIGSIAGPPLFTPCPTSRRSASEDQVAEAIRHDALAGIHHRGRAILLDDRRAVERVTGCQACTLVHRALDRLLREDDRPLAGERAGRMPVARGEIAQPGPRHRADAGDSHSHPLHR